jgi:ABC-type nitrate/sulfonate/bicarbonate transport system substrate-binding protein
MRASIHRLQMDSASGFGIALNAARQLSNLRFELPAALFIFAQPLAQTRQKDRTMSRTIRLQSDSNAHDRPWRVAVEQGFFAAEGLSVEYHEDNPKGTAGRVEDFSQRWKESQLQSGALEVYPVCEWGAIERVQALGTGKIIGLDTTVRTGALMVRMDSKIRSVSELRDVPIAVTWHAGTFYAVIEALEAAGVPFEQIKLVHANDRLEALVGGATEAAALTATRRSRLSFPADLNGI